jgi:hypothetical protein
MVDPTRRNRQARDAAGQLERHRRASAAAAEGERVIYLHNSAFSRFMRWLLRITQRGNTL